MGFVSLNFWPRDDGTASAMILAKEPEFEMDEFASKLSQDAAALPQVIILAWPCVPLQLRSCHTVKAV